MKHRHPLPLALLAAAAILSGCTSSDYALSNEPLVPHEGPLTDAETHDAIAAAKDRFEDAIAAAKDAVNAGDIEGALADAEAPEASESDREDAVSLVTKASALNQSIGENITRLTSQAQALSPGFSIDLNRGVESLKALTAKAQKTIFSNDEVLAGANTRLAGIKAGGAADEALKLTRAARDSAHGAVDTDAINNAIMGVEKIRDESVAAVSEAQAKAGDTDAHSDARALIAKLEEAANQAAGSVSTASSANNNLALSIALAQQSFATVADKTTNKAEAARIALEEAVKSHAENAAFLTFAEKRLADLKGAPSTLIATLATPAPVAITAPTPVQPALVITPVPVAPVATPVEPTVAQPAAVATLVVTDTAPVVITSTPVAPSQPAQTVRKSSSITERYVSLRSQLAAGLITREEYDKEVAGLTK